MAYTASGWYHNGNKPPRTHQHLHRRCPCSKRRSLLVHFRFPYIAGCLFGFQMTFPYKDRRRYFLRDIFTICKHAEQLRRNDATSAILSYHDYPRFFARFIHNAIYLRIFEALYTNGTKYRAIIRPLISYNWKTHRYRKQRARCQFEISYTRRRWKIRRGTPHEFTLPNVAADLVVVYRWNSPAAGVSRAKSISALLR